MKALLGLAAASLALVSVQVHAQGMNMSMEAKPAERTAAPALPFVNAEVKRVDAAKGSVVLRHGDIPNLGMGPMTMQFGVADKEMLKDLKVGDKVRFQVDMVKSKAVVTALERSK